MQDVSLKKCGNSLPAEAIVHKLGLILYLIVVFLPAGILLALSLLSYFSDPAYYMEYLIPGERQLSLLFNSILISILVSVSAMAVGFLAAAYLSGVKSEIIYRLRWLVFILIPIPPYVYALSWSSLASFTGFAFNGWPAVFIVDFMSFLPFAVLISLIGLESIRDDYIYAGRVFSSDTRVFFRIVLMLSKPAVLAGGLIIFILCLMDYSVASLFSENVYPLEIFAEYSSSGDISGSFMMSLPLVLISAVIAVFAGRYVREISWDFSRHEGRKADFELPRWISVAAFASVMVLGIGITTLFTTLIAETGSIDMFISSVTGATDDIIVTFFICIAGAAVCIPAALAVSSELSSEGRYSGLWWVLIILPLVMPPPLIGMGLIALWNGFMPLILHGTLVNPVFALLSRFTPFAVIIIFAFLKSGDKLLFDAGKIFSEGYLDSLKNIVVPMLLPGIAGAALLFFALGLGELGATLIVMPPGAETLTMRIYNYLHYGSSGTVAGLCLLMTIITAAAGLVLLLVIGKNIGGRWEKNDRD